jgi:hypothetical protein
VHSRKRIEVDLEYVGDGRIVERPRGVFRGGVPDPALGPRFGFNVLQLAADDEGVLVPEVGAGSYAGAFQVNVWGTSADYRALGSYFLALAELDASADPGFHQHHDELRTDDGRTQVDLIVRKLPEAAT